MYNEHSDESNKTIPIFLNMESSDESNDSDENNNESSSESSSESSDWKLLFFWKYSM